MASRLLGFSASWLFGFLAFRLLGFLAFWLLVGLLGFLAFLDGVRGLWWLFGFGFSHPLRTQIPHRNMRGARWQPNRVGNLQRSVANCG